MMRRFNFIVVALFPFLFFQFHSWINLFNLTPFELQVGYFESNLWESRVNFEYNKLMRKLIGVIILDKIPISIFRIITRN